MESPEGDSGRCGSMRVMSTDAEVDAGNKQLRTHRVTSGSSTPLKIDRSLLLKVRTWVYFSCVNIFPSIWCTMMEEVTYSLYRMSIMMFASVLFLL